MKSTRWRHAAVVVGLLVSVALAGCGASTEGSGASVRPSPSVTAGKLVGVEVSAVVCGTQYLNPVGASRVTGTVDSFVVCGMSIPGRSSSTMTVPRTSPAFIQLMHALLAPIPASPAAVSGSPVVCPLYADVPREVLAKTATGIWNLVLPTDECHHYTHDLVGILDSI